jgi:hypothetical protein
MARDEAKGAIGKQYSFHVFRTELTPEGAASWLKEFPFPFNRPVNKRRLQEYVQDMRAGKFGPSVLRLADSGQQRWLLDGNTRLNAQIASETSQEYSVHVDHVNGLAGAQALYALIDRNRARTTADLMRAFGLHDLIEINPTMVDRAATALALVMFGFENIPYSGQPNSVRTAHMMEKRKDMLLDWQDALTLWSRAVYGGQKKMVGLLLRQATMAVGLATMREQPDLAFEFWRRIAHNDGLQLRTAEHTLAKWLFNTEAREHVGWLYARYVALAWNHYFHGTTVSTLKLYDEGKNPDNPILIEGTVFDGKHVVRFI